MYRIRPWSSPEIGNQKHGPGGEEYSTFPSTGYRGGGRAMDQEGIPLNQRLRKSGTFSTNKGRGLLLLMVTTCSMQSLPIAD